MANISGHLMEANFCRAREMYAFIANMTDVRGVRRLGRADSQDALSLAWLDPCTPIWSDTIAG
ncbi:hypothetical protein IFR04_000494 [Cadophora malorum]|uniref:Uncharacterized protein n=1 Tax=Cadophora malorum TaxID=108018 RepID=A0A8H7WJZ5_9HELO|nr:hypothetical protein IFR04_000494 [Cadophora malorum]